MPVLAGLVLSMALLSVGITLAHDACASKTRWWRNSPPRLISVPVLRQQLAVLKRSQVEREQQLDRLLDLVAGTNRTANVPGGTQ